MTHFEPGRTISGNGLAWLMKSVLDDSNCNRSPSYVLPPCILQKEGQFVETGRKVNVHLHTCMVAVTIPDSGARIPDLGSETNHSRNKWIDWSGTVAGLP